jgi:hypothetical protein
MLLCGGWRMRHNRYVNPADPERDWRKHFRPDIPSGARIYDYLLDGKDNYPADREAAEKLIAQLPNAKLAVQWNRSFLRRVVRYMVGEAGLAQIIDIGAGLPTANPTHEVAQQVNPDARVVYVDHDPVVLAHGRDMLQGLPNVTIIEHEFAQPERILADEDLTAVIDFSQPVGVMLLSILHFIQDCDDPGGVIARILRQFPSGSHVAISHSVPDAMPSVADVQRLFDKATERARVRTRAEVAELVAGLEIVEPGLVWLPQWRPEPGATMPENLGESYYCAVVARKP